MKMLHLIPEVYSCCGIVTDLRTAAAFISLLAVVTSPLASWAVIRHSYVIRVACYVTTASERPDIIDLSLKNVVSFGFGMNAGLGSSCLSRNLSVYEDQLVAFSSLVDGHTYSVLFQVVKRFGWAVFTTDLIFVICAIYFFVKIFTGPTRLTALLFMIIALVSNLISSIYGFLFVACCVSLGGSLPLFELFFSLFDLGLWCYFIIVVNSFRLNIVAQPTIRTTQTTPNLNSMEKMTFLYGMTARRPYSKNSSSSSVYEATQAKTPNRLTLTGSHSVAMCFAPACEDMFLKKSREESNPLIAYSLIMIVITIIFITSTFVFLLGIFLDIPLRNVTGDVFIVSSLVWALCVVILGVLQIFHYKHCKCTNPSDIVICFIYPPCMIYFILIVSSYQELKDTG